MAQASKTHNVSQVLTNIPLPIQNTWLDAAARWPFSKPATIIIYQQALMVQLSPCSTNGNGVAAGDSHSPGTERGGAIPGALVESHLEMETVGLINFQFALTRNALAQIGGQIPAAKSTIAGDLSPSGNWRVLLGFPTVVANDGDWTRNRSTTNERIRISQLMVSRHTTRTAWTLPATD